MIEIFLVLRGISSSFSNLPPVEFLPFDAWRFAAQIWHWIFEWVEPWRKYEVPAELRCPVTFVLEVKFWAGCSRPAEIVDADVRLAERVNEEGLAELRGERVVTKIVLTKTRV